MEIGIAGDATTQALARALTGLSLRQRTIADDIANINTPGYLGHRVDFETSLRAAMADGADPSTTDQTVLTSVEPTRTDGNNVNLDEETLQSTEAGLRYQLVSNAVSNKFQLLRSAIREG